MQITVFGASGKVGSLVVEEALSRGYRVIAFTHSRDLFSPSGQLVVQKGDIYDAVEVAKALKGSGAIISCLGSWGTPRKDVLTEATRNIIPAMREHKIRRIITLTGHGANAPDERAGMAHRALFALLRPFPAGKVFRDGEEHMRSLATSGLEWTSLRSPIMNSLGGKGYRLSLDVGNQLATISREAVAQALLDQLDATDFLRQAPVVHRA